MNNSTDSALTQASETTRKLNPQIFQSGDLTIKLRPGVSPLQVAMIDTGGPSEASIPPKGNFVWSKAEKRYIKAPESKDAILAKIHQAKKISQGEKLRRRFEHVWHDEGGPELTPEFKFHPIRLWRFDFAVPSIRVGIEVDGGVFINGGHNRGAQITKDYEKRNSALCMGWRCFQLTSNIMKPDDIRPIVQVCNRLLKK